MACRLIVGCGYVGTRVARKWLENGDSVFAITRSSARKLELTQLGIEPIVWDWLTGGSPELTETFRKSAQTDVIETILVAVSHGSHPDIPHQETHTRGLSNLHSLLKSCGLLAKGTNQDTSHAKWIYLSTTGVFGASSPGDWVDEESTVSPERPGSVAAWAGEQWISSHVPADQQITLRPVGIYGPGRVPRWQSIRDEIPLQVDPMSFLNLIHVEDLASIIVKVASTKMNRNLYCVSDGEPVRRRDYYEFIAQFGGWPKPVFEVAKSGEHGPSGQRSDGNKRVRNRRIQSEIEWVMQFPSYREGLIAILGEQSTRTNL